MVSTAVPVKIQLDAYCIEIRCLDSVFVIRLDDE
jgi:hypothetical protein